ncbi:nucleotidyltransferase domain-containing protein [Carboxylicivirga taeanensis]|uniref:nucleotidyltransferase domain-containing protein n=1 Tax=Carboxylicivirga taeanensis TaxID=1416875 RepID=UPI003F6DE684
MKQKVSISAVKQLMKLCSVQDAPVLWDGPLSDELLRLGAANGVGAWCYRQVKCGQIEGISAESMSAWKGVYLNNTIRYQHYLSVFNRVSQALEAAGIPVVALKGIALSSSLYADEGLRPMGDIDLLVPEGEGLKALSVLLQKGAKPLVVPRSKYHEVTDAHVRAVEVNGIMVEIHQRLFALGSDFYTQTSDLFRHTLEIDKQGVGLRILDDKMQAYHLITHAIKGVEMDGLRLGWLLDIALLLNKAADLATFLDDVYSICPKKKTAMQQMVKMVMLLMPDKYISGSDDKEALMERIAFLLSEQNQSRKHRLINLKHLINTPGFSAKFKLLFFEFFPQKAYMKYRYQTDRKEPLWRLYLKRVFRF